MRSPRASFVRELESVGLRAADRLAVIAGHVRVRCRLSTLTVDCDRRPPTKTADCAGYQSV